VAQLIKDVSSTSGWAPANTALTDGRLDRTSATCGAITA
jgi:hypothetical protein